MIAVVLDGGGEEGVDEGSLAKAGLASNLHCLLETARQRVFPLCLSGLTIIVKAAPLLATILWRWLGRWAMPMPSTVLEAIFASGLRVSRVFVMSRVIICCGVQQ